MLRDSHAAGLLSVSVWEQCVFEPLGRGRVPLGALLLPILR